MTPLVSVIMPVYNGERFIVEAIESVLAQNYTNWELVIIDDGSTDSTASLIGALKEPRIRYFYQQNRGQAAALNVGLAMAQGDYITTLDADDCYTANSLADRVACLTAHREFGAVYADGYYCNAIGKVLLRFSENRHGNPSGDVYDTLVASSFFAAGSTVMIQRSVLEQHGLRYDESIVWCQDWDFYIRLAEHVSFGYVGAPAVRYRLHPSNMTASMLIGKRLQSVIRMKWKVLRSPRFAEMPAEQQAAFVYSFLVETLRGNPDEQVKVLDSSQFRALPDKEQGRLLRLAATALLLDEGDTAIAQQWLAEAKVRNRNDPKARAAGLLVHIHPGLARAALRVWRTRTPSSVSPLHAALAQDDSGSRIGEYGSLRKA